MWVFSRSSGRSLSCLCIKDKRQSGTLIFPAIDSKSTTAITTSPDKCLQRNQISVDVNCEECISCQADPPKRDQGNYGNEQPSIDCHCLTRGRSDCRHDDEEERPEEIRSSTRKELHKELRVTRDMHQRLKQVNKSAEWLHQPLLHEARRHHEEVPVSGASSLRVIG